MPQIIPLEAIPNQSLTIRLEERRYVITLRELNAGVMGVTIERDGVALVTNQRCVAGTALLPYAFLTDGAGNFIFTNTKPGELPAWPDFGVACLLVYSTASEIAEAVANG